MILHSVAFARVLLHFCVRRGRATEAEELQEEAAQGDRSISIRFAASVLLRRFLKMHFGTFRAELDAILARKPDHGYFTDMYLNSRTKPRNPRHLDTIGGGRKRVSYIF